MGSKIDIIYSEPKANQGKDVCELVKNCPPLDVNSEYLYLLMCDHFANTSIVAKIDSKIVGFISAYMIPTKPDTVFIWQVAVDKKYRGNGISSKMIQGILKRPACKSAKFLEATVTPSNESSKKMFEAAAKHLNCDIATSPYYTEEYFSEGHEPEDLIRIGPFTNE